MESLSRAMAFVIALFLSFTAAHSSAAEEGPTEPKAAFVMSAWEGDSWAQTMRRYAEAAASHFGIELTIHQGEYRREDVRAVFTEEILGENQPDYVLFTNQQGLAVELLEEMEQARIFAYIVNAGLSAEERKQYGGPGEKFRHWIGELTPNDEKAGYELAKQLIANARAANTNQDSQVNVLAFTGAYASPVAKLRVKGLKRAIAEDPHASLLQTVSARWSTEVSAEKTKWLIKRYRDVHVIWAANDGMALGAHSALPDGNNIAVGGMDWTDEARQAVRRGDLSVSMGGHFLDVIYALADIKEHSQCKLSRQSCLPRSQKSVLGLMTPKNAENRGALFDPQRIREFNLSKILSERKDIIASGEPWVSVDTFSRLAEREQ